MKYSDLFEVCKLKKITTSAAAVLFALACLTVGGAPIFAAEGAAVESKSAEGAEGHKGGEESCSISDPGQSAPIKFACTNTHPDCPEAEKVIQTLSLYAKAYVSQDYKTCAEYMTENITTFDLGSHKLIVGKEAVLADMKARLDKSAPGTDSPLLSYTIDHPMAQVKGNKACVNCIGIKIYGGKHPRKMESHSNYVFLKEDGKWKKSHFTTDWKKVSN